MTVDIRPATLDDAATISMLNVDVQQIHADALPWRFKQPGPDTFTPQHAAEHMRRHGYVTFLAHVDGEPAGYVSAEVARHPETARHHPHTLMYVHHITVRPHLRQRGVGRALLDAVKQHGESLGITLMALDTWAFNERALRFFQSYGLVPYNIRLWNKVD